MVAKAHAFDVGDYVVYPKHGVGRVIELQEQEIAGMTLELYVLRFEKERMTLRVPTNKVEAIGMRKLSSDKTLREALDTLKGKPKVKRTMWSRRAQEYEAKINSGDLVSIAEVTRDLFRVILGCVFVEDREDLLERCGLVGLLHRRKLARQAR